MKKGSIFVRKRREKKMAHLKNLTKIILVKGLFSEVQTGLKGLETQHGTGIYPNINKNGKLYQP